MDRADITVLRSALDRRLVKLAGEYEALAQRVLSAAATHPHLDPSGSVTSPLWAVAAGIRSLLGRWSRHTCGFVTVYAVTKPARPAMVSVWWSRAQAMRWANERGLTSFAYDISAYAVARPDVDLAEHERRERLRLLADLLDDWEDVHGPIPHELLDEVDSAWPDTQGHATQGAESPRATAPTSRPDAPRMSARDYGLLVTAGVLDGQVELIDGRVVIGDYDYLFGPAQARAAGTLGVLVPNCLDAVLADPELRAVAATHLGEC